MIKIKINRVKINEVLIREPQISENLREYIIGWDHNQDRNELFSKLKEENSNSIKLIMIWIDSTPTIRQFIILSTSDQNIPINAQKLYFPGENRVYCVLDGEYILHISDRLRIITEDIIDDNHIWFVYL